MSTMRRDLLTAATLGISTSVSRLPFVGRILYHWDSINFAYSLDEFDVARSQPHVPGYPLYVLLARGVHALIADPQQALAAISVAGSGLAVAWLYLLGLRLFDRRVALGASLLLASSPLYWFYGEIALPHSLDAFVVVFAVWLLWRVHSGEPKLLPWAALWLAAAGGFRPQTELFLLPLAVFAAIGAGRRQMLVAAVVVVVVDLLWFVPLAWLSGGVARYLELTREFYLAFNTTTSIFSGGGLFGLRRNALKLSMYTLYGWGMALPLAVLGVAAMVAARSLGFERLRRLALDRRTLFLALWVLPTLAYYQFIHMGQQGLVFVFLPALCLVSSLVASALGSMRAAAIAAAVIGNAAIFLLAPTFPLGGDRPKLLTRDTLRRHDQSYVSRIAAVRGHFDPSQTILLSAGWRFPQFYLADYRLLSYGIGQRWEATEGQSLVRERQMLSPSALGLRGDAGGWRYAVLFDPELQDFNAARERVEWVDLDGGGRLAFLRLGPGEGLSLGPDSFAVTPSRASRGSP